MAREYRNIARVVAPHGTKGEVSVAGLRGLPFLLRPDMTVALTPPALDRDRFCRVEHVNDDGMLARFSGIASLDDAEGIAGCYVLARESDLDVGPLDAAADELIGREVRDGRYGSVGRIADVMETPANDVWVVQGPYGEVLIPVVEAAVEDVPESGPVRTHLMDGLIEVGPEDAPEAPACS